MVEAVVVGAVVAVVPQTQVPYDLVPQTQVLYDLVQLEDEKDIEQTVNHHFYNNKKHHVQVCNIILLCHVFHRKIMPMLDWEYIATPDFHYVLFLTIRMAFE